MRKHDQSSMAAEGARRATGAAAARDRKGRFSARCKRATVLRLLRGEDLESVSRELGALLHESSLARTRPTDRILTGRCDTTLVGRGRSSDSRSHSRGQPHSPVQLDSGREDHRR